MQRDVAVAAQLAERHVQPVGRADLDHRIDGQIEELALAQPSAGEELDRQPGERVRVLAGGAQELRRRRVVDEPRQRLIAARHVAREHQHARGGVVAVPLAQPLKAGAQGAELLGQPGLREPPAAGRGAAGQVALVALDVGAAQIGDRPHLRRLGGQPAGELAQHRLDPDHRRRPQRQAHLLDIALKRRPQPRRDRRPLPRPDVRLVPVALARRHLDHAVVKQGRLGAEQPRRQRPHPQRVIRMQAAGRRDQPLATGVELGLGQALRRNPREGGDLCDRRPLQPRRLPVEPELGRGLKKPGVELAVNPRRDLADPNPARHQILRCGPQAAGHDQPGHQAAVVASDGALLRERQTRPALHTHAQQERARRRSDLLLGELTGVLEIRPVGGDQRLHLRVALQAPHDASSPASGTICASIASAAARYSPASQSLASCR
jgi:hypothetical protein